MNLEKRRYLFLFILEFNVYNIIDVGFFSYFINIEYK